jgi:hypothetical protein
MKTATTVWLILAIVLPVIVAIYIFTNPTVDGVPLTVYQIGRMLVIRNIVYSGLLLFSFLRLPKKVTGVILIGRGVTDFLDAITGFIAYGGISQMEMMPFILSFVSMAAGYYFYKKSS